MRLIWPKLLSLLIFCCLIGTFFALGFGRYFTLDQLQESKHQLQLYYRDHQLLTMLVYCFVYIVASALSLPGALSLTFAAGAIFGPWWGTLLASLSSAVGATGAFLSARYIIGHSIQKRFKNRLETVNRGIQEEGGFYLMSLRLIAVFPYFMINLVMGLTTISVRVFFLATLVGMLPVIFLYTYTGTELSQIKSFRDILSTRLVLSFLAMALLPLLAKKIILSWHKRRP